MKIKSKLQLGFWLLFGSIILGGALSLYYLRQISRSSEIILKENYRTLNYTREMRQVLDENNGPLPLAAVKEFEEELIKEENNITEKGEAEVVSHLRQNFEILRNNTVATPEKQQALRTVRLALREIEELNMQAIIVKTDLAQKSIKQATIYLSVIGCLTFLFMFSFIFNLIDLITVSVKEQNV